MADEVTPQVFPNRFADAVGPAGDEPSRDRCRCVGYSLKTRPETVSFHEDRQDTEAAGWHHLLALIDEAVADGRTVFQPFPSARGEGEAVVPVEPLAVPGVDCGRRHDRVGAGLGVGVAGHEGLAGRAARDGHGLDG